MKLLDNESVNLLIHFIYDALQYEHAELFLNDTVDDVISSSFDAHDSATFFSDFVRSSGQSLYNPAVPSDENQARVDALLGHIRHAISLNVKNYKIEVERDAFYDVLQKMPIGVLLADVNGEVVTHNQYFQDMLSQHAALSIKNNRLVYGGKASQFHTDNLVSHLAADFGEQRSFITRVPVDSGDTSDCLMLIYRANYAEFDPRNKSLYVLFCYTEMLAQSLSVDLLMSIYSLTHAEAQLTRILVSGYDINEAALHLNVSVHTTRTHLKSIFKKTNTHRQAELVSTVLTGPGLIARLAGSPVSKQVNKGADFNKIKSTDYAVLENYFEMKDKRRICYAQYGDADGFPVFFCHGIFGSRLQRHPDDSIIKALGMRLIIPDRPGFGLSDAKADRTLLDWADDMVQLADSLDIDRFSVLGYCSGGPHALACAYRYPERVLRLCLVSSFTPYTLSMLADMRPLSRLMLGVAQYSPALLKLMLRPVFKGQKYLFVRSPRFLRNIMDANYSRCTEDSIQANIAENLAEVFRNTDATITDDVLAISRAWDFELASVNVEVQAWYGAGDREMPLTFAEGLNALPNININIIPDMDHSLIYLHWKEILQTLGEDLDQKSSQCIH